MLQEQGDAGAGHPHDGGADPVKARTGRAFRVFLFPRCEARAMDAGTSSANGSRVKMETRSLRRDPGSCGSARSPPRRTQVTGTDVGPFELRTPKLRATQVRALKIRPPQVGRFQVGSPEIRVPKVRAAEVFSLQHRAPEVGPNSRIGPSPGVPRLDAFSQLRQMLQVRHGPGPLNAVKRRPPSRPDRGASLRPDLVPPACLTPDGPVRSGPTGSTPVRARHAHGLISAPSKFALSTSTQSSSTSRMLANRRSALRKVAQRRLARRRSAPRKSAS